MMMKNADTVYSTSMRSGTSGARTATRCGVFSRIRMRMGVVGVEQGLAAGLEV
jgi:hypothetical protein